MAHKCKALVLSCMDFRLFKPLKERLKKEGLAGDCDEVRVAGSCKTLLSPEKESDRDFLLGQIGISVNLHQTREVVLINHADCGAYGGSGNFSSLEQEKEFHAKEMEKAREIILEKYPHLKISLVLADIDPQGSVEFKDLR